MKTTDLIPSFTVALLLAAAFPLKAGVIATSSTEFSGVQGQNGWTYGYRDVPAGGASENYDPVRDFIPFSGGDGQGDWNGTTQQWTGSEWKFHAGADGIEGGMGSGNAAPGASTRWMVRRWQSTKLTQKGPVSLRWTLAKGDSSCGNGVTGAVYINGQMADQLTIAFDRATILTRTYYALLTPGDMVDLVLRPLGSDGAHDAQCDKALMSVTINDTITAVDPKQPNGRFFLSSLATPKLQIIAQTHSGTQSALNWRSQASGTYGIEATSDWVNWTKIKTGLPGGPTITSWSEETTESPHAGRFYRVVQESKTIEGLWVARYDNAYDELVRIKLDGDQAVATKVIGDIIVPAGKVSWWASVTTGVTEVQGAHDGFTNPFLIPGTLRIINPDRLLLNVPSYDVTLTFRRVD